MRLFKTASLLITSLTLAVLGACVLVVCLLAYLLSHAAYGTDCPNGKNAGPFLLTVEPRCPSAPRISFFGEVADSGFSWECEPTGRKLKIDIHKLEVDAQNFGPLSICDNILIDHYRVVVNGIERHALADAPIAKQ